MQTSALPMDLLSFLKPKLAIHNCTTGRGAAIDNFPAWVGGREAHFQVDDSDNALCEFAHGAGGLSIKAFNENGLVLNGESKSTANLLPEHDYALQIDGHLILFSYTKKSREWLSTRGQDIWRIVDKNSNILAGPAPLRALDSMAANAHAKAPRAILHQTHSASGFYLSSVADILGFDLTKATETTPSARAVGASLPRATSNGDFAPPPGPGSPQESAPDVNMDSGEFTCPACWLRFDRGDVMHIAAHASLRGDPVLGEEAMIRFNATRFNDRGQAVDAMGIPVTDLSCPHCRRKLPPSFLDIPQHIISIVGAPSSGKSYYLSVLVKVLQHTLFKNYGAAFYDGDPSENIRLTEMKNKLFSASTPAEAKLAKTDLEGDMYIEVPRMGRKVRMPKPFVFNMGRPERPDQTVSMVFYDNAGEHFEPGISNLEKPGAQHVAAASGIIFLFDPTYNLEFRKRLSGHHDPQIKDRRFDQQDTLLAEMNARVKTILSLDFREKIRTPLAVIVGKCDVWQGIVGEENFRNPVRQGILDLAAIKHNSSLVREMLLEIAPPIVANAEAVSEDVMFFPVSAFGCSPEVVGKDAKGQAIFSPDPNKISPIMVDVPMLWLVSHFEPNLVQAVSAT